MAPAVIVVLLVVMAGGPCVAWLTFVMWQRKNLAPYVIRTRLDPGTVHATFVDQAAIDGWKVESASPSRTVVHARLGVTILRAGIELRTVVGHGGTAVGLSGYARPLSHSHSRRIQACTRRVVDALHAMDPSATVVRRSMNDRFGRVADSTAVFYGNHGVGLEQIAPDNLGLARYVNPPEEP